MGRMSHRLPVLLAVALCWGGAACGADALSYATEQSCAADNKLGAERCANAAANAQAEFIEKAPRFQTRDACERVFGRGGCSIGFSGADGLAGNKSGIYLAPRQAGFRISGRNMTVAPYVSGHALAFSPRTILRKDTRVDPRKARLSAEAWRGGGREPKFGLANPAPGGARGALPPRPAFDPNFDCGAFLEPGAGDDKEPGCYPAPARR